MPSDPSDFQNDPSIEAALARLREGRMVILTDDEDRENEGDLVFAAEFVTADAINFMARFGRGLICCALSPEIIDRLELPLMTPKERNRSGFGTAFTVSVEARTGVSTGISAADRARTIRLLADSQTGPQDLVTPGHVFPLRAQAGGVLARGGQTEGSVDLMKMAGLTPAAVICEIMRDDGAMARRPDLDRFAEEHDVPIVSVAALVRARTRQGDRAKARHPVVRRAGDATLPTDHGRFRVHAYVDDAGREHLALVSEPMGAAPLVRIHSECLTGDALGSHRCDCGGQLRSALDRLAAEGGVLIYVRQEGRGIGLAAKIQAYALQEHGLDTYAANEALGHQADARSYDAAADILRDLGVKRVRLLTNNPAKVRGLEREGVEVVERTPHEAPGPVHAKQYLKAKAERGGHVLSPDTLAALEE